VLALQDCDANELVFWRENKDCAGKKPWQILLNRK
jgi:hypothetical protein